jgi:hypothetical protein
MPVGAAGSTLAYDDNGKHLSRFVPFSPAMLSFRPHGNQDARVITDHSRFAHEPRIRSRNTTPPSTANTETSSIHLAEPHRQPTMIEIAERNYLMRDPHDERNSLYDYYMAPSSDYVTERLQTAFAPYPESVRDQPTELPQNPHSFHLPDPPAVGPPPVPMPPHEPQSAPPPPPKDTKHYRDSRYTTNTAAETLTQDNDLPAMMTPRGLTMPPPDAAGVMGPDANSVTSRQKDLEEKLVRSVLNRPVLVIPTRKYTGANTYEETELLVSYNFVMYVLEIIIAIVIITLAGILLHNDTEAKRGIYRFLIANGSITLVVSALFVLTIIDFEKKNGSFYCFLTFVVNFVAFIMVVSNVLGNKTCTDRAMCHLRRAVSAFVIISMFVWFANTIVYVTTYYISRLGLLNDLQFDFNDKHGHLGPSQSTPPDQFAEEYPLAGKGMIRERKIEYGIDTATGAPLREYILNEDGHMYEVSNRMEVQGRNKILVYTF